MEDIARPGAASEQGAVQPNSSVTDRVSSAGPTSSRRSARAVGWTMASVLLLVLLYAAVLALGDTRAYSGSDAGGKAATAKIMAERGSADPDIGYWAASSDPEGLRHPIVNTLPRGDRWVQATSLPFSQATAWLWGLAGPAGALALPVAGGVLAALAARALARNLGASATAAEVAFWVVGAVGPVGFYATDMWEHAPAAGLVLAVAAAAVHPRGRVAALGAGVAAGAAVVLRAEAAVVLAALVLAVLAVGSLRRRWLARPLSIGLAAVGAVAVLLANSWDERAYLGGDLRGGRAGTLAAGIGSQLLGRLRDAALESAGPFADDHVLGVLSAVLLAGCALGLAAVALDRWRAPGPVVRVLAVLGVAVYAGRAALGLGFVPGMLAVAPFAAAGVVGGLRRPGRAPSAAIEGDEAGGDGANADEDAVAARLVVAAAAVGALPMIWLLQWQGNHSAQWGGRYVLIPGALLAVVGVVAAYERPVPVAYRRALLGLSLLVGASGLAWHVQRTTTVGRTFDRISALPTDTVVVSTDANFLREGGAFYGDQRWLLVADPAELFGPRGLAARYDVTDLAVVVDATAGPQVADEVAGWKRTGSVVLDVPGGEREMVLLRATSP